MLMLEKADLWKNQPGNEVHKIFSVVSHPVAFRHNFGELSDTARLDRRKIPNYEDL